MRAAHRVEINQGTLRKNRVDRAPHSERCHRRSKIQKKGLDSRRSEIPIDQRPNLCSQMPALITRNFHFIMEQLLAPGVQSGIWGLNSINGQRYKMKIAILRYIPPGRCSTYTPDGTLKLRWAKHQVKAAPKYPASIRSAKKIRGREAARESVKWPQIRARHLNEDYAAIAKCATSPRSGKWEAERQLRDSCNKIRAPVKGWKSVTSLVVGNSPT